MNNIVSPKDVAGWLAQRVLAEYPGGSFLAERVYAAAIDKMLCRHTLVQMAEGTDIAGFTLQLYDCGFLTCTPVGVHKTFLSKLLLKLACEGGEGAAQIAVTEGGAVTDTTVTTVAQRGQRCQPEIDPHLCTALVVFGEKPACSDSELAASRTQLSICDGPSDQTQLSICDGPADPTLIMDLGTYWGSDCYIEHRGTVINEDVDGTEAIPSGYVPRHIIFVTDHHARPGIAMPEATSLWLPEDSPALHALDALIKQECPPPYMAMDQGSCTYEPIALTPICTGCDMCSAEESSGSSATEPLSTPPRKEPVPKRKRESSDRAKDKRSKHSKRSKRTVLTALEVIDLTED